ITRAVEEAGRMTAAAGGDARTLLGLAGYGDLLATIAQPERPEVLGGEGPAQGKSLEQALAEAHQRVEAVELTGQLVAWAAARDVRAPIFGTLASDVLTGRTSDALVRELMQGWRPAPSLGRRLLEQRAARHRALVAEALRDARRDLLDASALLG